MRPFAHGAGELGGVDDGEFILGFAQPTLLPAGEQLTPHLAVLFSSQLKLVTIYINRTTKARADQLDLQQHD